MYYERPKKIETKEENLKASDTFEQSSTQ